MKTLFPKRKPKILKYTPSPYVRKMESVEFDVKSDYRKFAEFLRLSSDDLGRVKLPKKDELTKLNKETKPKPGKEDGGFGGLIGKLVSALPVIGTIAIPALKIGAIAALGLGAASFLGREPSTGGAGTALFPRRNPRGGRRGSGVRRRGSGVRGRNQRRGGGVRGRNQRRGGGTNNRSTRGSGVTSGGTTRPGTGTTARPARVAPSGSANQRLGRSSFQLEQARRAVSPVRPVAPPVSRFTKITDFLKAMPAKAKKKLAFKLGKKFLMPIIKRVPFIGPLIDFALNVFLFKVAPGKAAFKAIGSALGSAILGGLLSIIPFVGTAVGVVGGAFVGDALGEFLYDSIFSGKKAQATIDRKVGQRAVLGGKPVEWDGTEWISVESGEPQGSSEDSDKPDPDVIPATHPDTGSGYTVKGLLDYQGRPVVLSKAGATAFARMVRDSMGVVKGSDVHSSQRSKEKNDSLPNAAPNSNHLYGNAIDIHGESQQWIRANGAKYGWKINDYPGSHGGHFNYKSTGSPQTETDSSKTSAVQPVTPVMGNLPSDYGSSEAAVFAAERAYQEAKRMKAQMKDTEVSRLTPAAEAATSDNVVVISQAPSPSQGDQGSQFIPVPIGGGRSGGSSVASIDPNQLVNSMHESLLLTKLANA